MTTIPVELLPCPFCGGDAEPREYDCEHFVQCIECFNSTAADHQTDAEAAAAWNRRTLLAEQPQAGAGQLPVEWRCRIAGSDHYAHFPTKRCRFCEPLYTAQPPQIDEVRRLREALEKVGDRLEAFIDDEMDMPHASMEVCKGIIDAALTHPPKGEEE